MLDAICLIDELANAVAVELLLDRVPGHALGLEQGILALIYAYEG